MRHGPREAVGCEDRACCMQPVRLGAMDRAAKRNLVTAASLLQPAASLPQADDRQTGINHMRRFAIFAATIALGLASPASAQEIFAGAYFHEVETPLTFEVDEGGADIQAGYRFAPVEALGFIGKPQPYVLASINTAGDTSFAGGGLSWKVGVGGDIYVRPGIGLIVHDGPGERFDPVSGQRTDLGSRVLFEPEIAIGARVSDRLSIEASWVHISHAQLLNSEQNPGIDMMGVRLNWAM